MVALLALHVAASASHADVVVGSRAGVFLRGNPWLDASLHRVSTPDDTIVAQADIGDYGLLDLAPGPDGRYYFGSNQGIECVAYASADLSSTQCLAPVRDVLDLGFDSRGDLFALNFATGREPFSGIFRVLPDGSAELVDSILDFDMQGMDVPRAGPYADGLIVIGWDRRNDGYFHLYRYRREADGTFTREGPFGPLWDLVHPNDCTGFGPTARHPTMRPDGLSFLVVEGCDLDLVKELDLDGNLVRVLAHVGEDPTLLDPDPWDLDGIYDDSPTNVHCDPSGDVYVSTFRRLYHLDAQGGLIRKLDHVFHGATAICADKWTPPPVQCTHCEPEGLGYWKRQCADDAPTRRGGFHRRVPVPSRPGLHPDFRDGRLPPLMERVDARLASFGTTTCAALWPASQRELRARALMHHAAVLLNIEDCRLGPACTTTIEGVPHEVGEAVASLEALLRDGSDDALRRAVQLAERILASQ